MAAVDEFREVRRRAKRRCVDSLNALAMRDDRLPRDGAFDSAVANALAAIVAYKESGREYEDSERRVRAPSELLSIVRNDASVRNQHPQQSQFENPEEGNQEGTEVSPWAR